MKTPQVTTPGTRYYLPSFVAASAGQGRRHVHNVDCGENRSECGLAERRRAPRLPRCTVGICEQPAIYADIWCAAHRGANNGD